MTVPDNSLYRTPDARHAGAREAIVCVLLAAFVLVLLAGPSVRSAGEEMNRGVVRSGVFAGPTSGGAGFRRVRRGSSEPSPLGERPAGPAALVTLLVGGAWLGMP